MDVLGGGGFAGGQVNMQLLRPWLVDNAGHVVDRFGLSHPVYRGRLFSCARDYEPSYLSGAFSIYRVDVLRKLGTPFSDVYEAYFDDKLLGARLRRCGYRTFHKAIVAGFYLGSASYGPRRLFKSARWFKYVSVAELIPVFKTRLFLLTPASRTAISLLTCREADAGFPIRSAFYAVFKL